MKAPYREAEGDDQKSNRKHFPGDAGGGIAGTTLPDFWNLSLWNLPLRGLRQCSGCGGHVVGNGLVFVDTQVAGVGTDKAFIKDSAGKLVELFFFDGDQETGSDLGRQRYVVQSDLALFPFLL
jgi:hypothetical protein